MAVEMKKKVLVTGANGLLGANIVNQLILGGYSARAMVRPGCNLKTLRDQPCEIFEGQLTKKEDLDQAVKGCDYVIHCAARTGQNPTRLEAYIGPNVNSTSDIIELCIKYRVKRLIYISTINCFTNGTLKKPGTEESGLMPWIKKSGYAYSKYMSQELVLKAVRENQIDAVVVAPSFVIGPLDSRPSSGQLVLHGLNSKLVFFPQGGKCILDVQNGAKAVVNSLIKGRNGECYILAGENITYKNIFRILKQISGQHKVLIPVPRVLLLGISLFADLITKPFGITNPLNYVNMRLLSLGNYFSNEKAANELGLQPTSAKESFISAIKWFDENGYLKKPG
jgi:dihydroflavonol-4-reductase